ncbi:transposase [Vreelandella andesensis]|uniref:Transposase n=1 Tax=Vreelandella andesensis TaxID=447567 RepID=A0A433KGA9_9GAMM|nr:transposase [Halomonas andesensis]RUR27829.1 transposase [Halomonas andesensis]
MPFAVADILDAQDWQSFEAQYASTGRALYAPRSMMGLILHGVMQGISSLRGIEHLARVDVACMWVTGGITPDHANIGRFIARHEHQLTHGFFEAVTRTVLHRMGSKSDRLAGDGTVIEAACSHYRHLKAEAVNAWVQQAEQEVEKAVTHNNAPAEQAAHKLEQAHHC